MPKGKYSAPYRRPRGVPATGHDNGSSRANKSMSKKSKAMPKSQNSNSKSTY